MFGALGAMTAFGFFFYSPLFSATTEWSVEANASRLLVATSVPQAVVEDPCPVTHIKTPEPVRALYMTSWVAGTPSLRDKVIKIVDETEANALVVDVKDDTGRIAFEMKDPRIEKMGSVEKRIPEPCLFVKSLHDKGIYVIARIAVFQDVFLAEKRPDLAVLNARTGKVWKDRKNLAWIDAGSREMWEYISAIGKEAYALGFDEINFDYVRFPTDGKTTELQYQHFDEKTMERSEQIEKFFAFLDSEFRPAGIPISADIFGVTTTETDDQGIGQILERALPYFDFVAPMIYPSHYGSGFAGQENPAAAPYEVITHAMRRGIDRAVAASSSPHKFRPWLQDFDLGATYTPEMVRAQKKALYDLGITSWMMWDASNKYTVGALDPSLEP